MENLEIGKLYVCEKYHLLLYPGEPLAGFAHGVAAPSASEAAENAAYWSKRLGKPVSYVDKNIPLLVLNSKKKLHEVLAGDRKGWIIYHDSLHYKEIV